MDEVTQKLPPGKIGRNFYALAYVEGRYKSPSGSMDEPSFMTLYHWVRGEKDFLIFYCSTHEGRWVSTLNNVDDRGVAYAVLVGLEEFQIRPSQWKLFRDHQQKPLFKSSRSERAQRYEHLATQLSEIVSYFFAHDLVQNMFKGIEIPRLFYPNAPEPLPESEEEFSFEFDGTVPDSD